MELTALLLAAVVPLCQAQTYTDCDPLKSTCPDDNAMKAKTFTTDFKAGSSLPKGWHSVQCAGDIKYGKDGGAMVVAKKGDCPTIETDDYVLFGMFEVKMKSSPGQGLISSIVLQSDVRDEVDWEFLGGDNARVQSNYFGKYDQSEFNRMVQIPVADPQNQWHTYGVNWTSAAITWLIDGVAVRTLKYEDAKGGTRFPQTPMRFRLGIWAGGDPSNPKGTIDWAGGLTDFSKAPFAMSIDSTTITNYSPADKYHYKDNSGDWKSIEVIGGSAGGIVSAGQQSVQNDVQSSSTAGQSTGSTKVPDLPIETAKPSGVATQFSNTTISTTLSNSSSSAAAPKASTSSSSAAAPSASKSSPSAAKATNSASGLGGVREVVGISVFSIISLILFS